TEFSWSPGTPITVAPGGSATLTVSFNPVDADAHTGCLTLASNDPAAPSVTLAISGTGNLGQPPPNPQPGIELDPASLDFGTVATGGSVSRTLKITNTGAASLDVTSIALCSGTSTEFTWSPSAPLTIAAGAELVLTVTYAPVDVGTDTGCLEVASNDPVTPAAQVNLTGTGAQPAGGLDLDIKRFRATKEVDVGEQVRFRLVVKNAGQVEGQAPATLVGTQKGAEVYRETITVSAPLGRTVSTFTFPPFTPTATGKIRWTVTIQDQNAGRNTATAVTKVEGRERERDEEGEDREHDEHEDED
ncbi:MAG TPA: choice-of-anchor D domain-containing protein, partial [Candidatus Methylomirabilis sp.]|nr:choice-of-anchor D domain-containing protein [Candidatus Methylomirabilis sp.]